jgi:hypothetical protein
MIKFETKRHHVANNVLLFAVSAGTLAWSIFALWTVTMQLMEILRG